MIVKSNQFFQHPGLEISELYLLKGSIKFLFNFILLDSIQTVCFPWNSLVILDCFSIYSELQRQKNRVKQRNDFGEAAKICNCIGELYSSNGKLFDIRNVFNIKSKYNGTYCACTLLRNLSTCIKISYKWQDSKNSGNLKIVWLVWKI